VNQVRTPNSKERYGQHVSAVYNDYESREKRELKPHLVFWSAVFNMTSRRKNHYRRGDSMHARGCFVKSRKKSCVITGLQPLSKDVLTVSNGDSFGKNVISKKHHLMEKFDGSA